MNTIDIYEPIFKPGDDEKPPVIQINVVVNALIKAGLDVHLHNFDDEPNSYLGNVRPVDEVILRDGPEVFPITVMNGEVVKKKTYPCYDELLKWSAGVEDLN